MTDMTPEQAQFEECVNSSPDKFDLSLTHHHLSGEADLYYLNRDTNIAFLAFRAALSDNGGEAMGRLIVEHFRGDSKMQNVDYEHYGDVLPEGRHVLYTRPTPPPVAVPEKLEWNQAGGRDHRNFTDGWNACREAMLSDAASKKEQQHDKA